MKTLDKLNYEQALNRLEEIADLVRKKEISLEDSLDLLDESIRLAALCNQQIDYTAWLSRPDDDSSREDVVVG